MNKRVLESLIKAGAFDSFGRRAQLASAADKAMERAQKAQRDNAAGQHGLFGLFEQTPGAAAHDLTRCRTFRTGTSQRLQSEKEVLGFFRLWSSAG